jgi:hypothetical protein
VSSIEPGVRTEDRPGDQDRPSSPDPWGVRRAENLLTSLQDVLSARMEVSPSGEVTAVHILTSAGVPPKQMVRNVESALLAQLGLKIDHRKISVAQTAEVRPIEALERSAVRSEALRRPVIFRALEHESIGDHRVRLRVVFLINGQEMRSEEEVADTIRARMQGAARAALRMLSGYVTTGAMALDGVKITDAFDAQLAVVAVQTIEGRDPETVLGTAPIRESPERAAVLAALDATNRWVQLRGAG